MDIEKLKLIVNANIPEDRMEHLICELLAQDENVIPNIMKILNAERSIKKEVMTEMNNLLSKTHIIIKNPEWNIENFIDKEVIEFFKKYKDIKGVGHNYKEVNFDEN